MIYIYTFLFLVSLDLNKEINAAVCSDKFSDVMVVYLLISYK